MRRLQRFLRWANVGLIFITLFAYLSPYIHPAHLWPFAVLGLFYPVLLVLNLLFVVIWAVQRRWYALFSLGCILMGWSHFTAFIGINFAAGEPAVQEGQLRVLSYNIYGFLNQKAEESATAGKRWTEEQLLSFYAEHQPDVWCIEEFTGVPKHADQYIDLITTKTPLKYVYHKRDGGIAIFSRYPLSPVHTEYFNSTNGFAIADLEKDGKKIRVAAVHLQSNAVSRMAADVAETGNIQEKETWLQIKSIIGRYRRTTALRAEQAIKIHQMLQESPYPLILCGDFNDVPLSYVYHTLSSGLTDGFRKKGKGIGSTFRGNLPALRIDYILSGPQLPPIYYRVLPIDRSDHYPVLSILKITE